MNKPVAVAGATNLSASVSRLDGISAPSLVRAARARKAEQVVHPVGFAPRHQHRNRYAKVETLRGGTTRHAVFDGSIRRERKYGDNVKHVGLLVELAWSNHDRLALRQSGRI